MGYLSIVLLLLALCSMLLARKRLMAHFRFMDLEIWKESIDLNDQLFDLADLMGDAKSFRVVEQLRSASLSIQTILLKVPVLFQTKILQTF